MVRQIFIVTIFASLLISACSSAGPEPSVTEQENSIPSETTGAAATASQTHAVTDTPTPDSDQQSGTPPQQTASITSTPSVEIQSSGPDDYPEGYNPLTGVPVEEPSLLNRRPLAVKIQLYPRGGRPPRGISQADIVYDYYQNDGLTRLNAIFYSRDAEQVGPIRSARIFDEHIMRMYKTIFAFGGADWRVFDIIYDADLRDLMVVEGSHNCPPMCRVDPNAANYLVTNTEELSLYIDEKGVENGRQPLEGMSFDTQIPDGGKRGDSIEVRWSISAYIRWTYDPDTGTYLREQDNVEAGNRQAEEFKPMTDLLTGEQITAENIIVIPLSHVDLFPQNKFEIMDIQLPPGESGTAYAFRDGQVYEVMWNRPALDSVLYLTYQDGTDFPFKPGNTWFEIVGKSSIVSQPESGLWRFEFRF